MAKTRKQINKEAQDKIRAAQKAKAIAKGWKSWSEFVTAVMKDEAELPIKKKENDMSDTRERVQKWLEEYDIADLIDAAQHLENYVEFGWMTMKPQIVGLWAEAAGGTNDADVVMERVKIALEVVRETLDAAQKNAALHAEAALYEIIHDL